MSRYSALESNYHFEYDIGQWTYGTIQAVREKASGKKRICKTVPKVDHLDLKKVRQDLKNLQRLSRHPHVCALLEVVEEETCLHLIVEDCEGEDVSELLSRLDERNWLDEQTVAVYILQALIAAVHCHGAGIAHGDLRTSSLGLTTRLPDAAVKVSDFGFNCIFDPQRSCLRQNPSPFTPPELLTGQLGVGAHPAGDIWSIGAVAYHLLVNKPPGEVPVGRAWGISVSERPEFRPGDGWDERSAESKHFLECLLCPVHERLNAAQALQHPWIRRVAPQGSQKWARTPGGAAEAWAQYEQRMVSFSLSVLLIPILIEPLNFEHEKALFSEMDDNSDGFVARARIGTEMRNRGLKDEAIDEALDVADALRTGALDLCAFLVACLLASQPKLSTGSAYKMLEKHFCKVFCSGTQPPVLQGATVWSRLQTNNTRQQLERDTQVRYSEILKHLPDNQQPVEVSDFIARLQQACGNGTPLELPGEEHCEPESFIDEGPPAVASQVQDALDFAHNLFNLNFVKIFSRCTTLERNPSRTGIENALQRTGGTDRILMAV
eukprot:gnl/MRDRNA2_/MRDRNA2_62686_c0_seq1.p1 gnl/MRDRNA2_/MRDRNA2_62686_c0~~gnl/MRDRNA2_/MRDRNA2_62686_c0_seq1.p1  ORF type:complete len:550 (+),score=82.07 gnl/MRDRNA2_/MRDRNA2_62686_c0_seq1:95-1744(+)